MKITQQDFEALRAWAFSSDNPGYRPTVIEAPAADGMAWDEGKRYAHIAPKYKMERSQLATRIWTLAYIEAQQIATKLGLPAPGEDSTLRVLEYPPGTGSAPHTDFDLFTLCLYRNDMVPFRRLRGSDDPIMRRLDAHHSGFHFGELAEIFSGGVLQATEHVVDASATAQYSAVFFAIPAHTERLPGITVGEWLEAKKANARKNVQERT